MKVLVFGGAGKMGRAVAYDLVQQEDVTTVGLAGRNLTALQEGQKWLSSPKVQVHAVDVLNKPEVQALARTYDVVVSTLPDRRTSYALAAAVLEAGVHLVDMLEEYHRRPDRYEVEGLQLPPGMDLDAYGDFLHETALHHGVTFLDGMGFAPGISNITCGEGIRRLDRARRVIARVGGIPEKQAAQRHPLRYMITWAFSHVLREYNVKLFILEHGEKVEVEAGTGRETFRFNFFGYDETLECAMTPGMPSFIYTRPQLEYFAEKTVRWPGHWDGVQTLKECGLLSLEPVEVGGHQVVPREVLLACIEPRLVPQPGEEDVCVMYNTVEGEKDGRPARWVYAMWERPDPATGISAMGRVTGFPTAIGALFLGRGLISQKGIVPPEEAFAGPLYTQFMEELAKRQIHIHEQLEFLS
ncbi:MAG: saccharopine dehydrogenase NADP-binding domain-containing protein [Thermoanaerobaculum sp.]|nr:saccharopine dehydrogenase NADP-binding domain-containing protein [Thermoanaerobaculum sp.]MDW7968191.1 saccharopine dehydrogenase C-terminal domain-containing protein [Thermoanaerobaculum sp.]